MQEAKKAAKIAYMTDGHGDISAYEKLFERAEKPDVLGVLIGGDVSPRAMIKTQMDFIKGYLLPRIFEFKKKFAKETYLILGNADYMELTKILEDAESKGVLTLTHNSVCKLEGGYEIVGYHFLSPSKHFWFAEWERPEPQIKHDLEKLADHVEDMGKAIFMFHSPPLDTKLDMSLLTQHAGSFSVRGFIEHRKPLLTLHGHIHESPSISGEISEKLGSTLAVNPGSAKPITIDLKTMEIEMI